MPFNLEAIFGRKIDKHTQQPPVGSEFMQPTPTLLDATKTPDQVRQEANALAAKLNEITPAV